MPKDTKFSLDWLERSDNDGVQVKRWLRQGTTDTTFQCTYCKTGDRDCSNQGWRAVAQHMNTLGHVKTIKSLKNNSKFVVEPTNSQTLLSNDPPTTNTLGLDDTKKSPTLNFDEQVTKAEAIWSLNVARRGFSYNSCDGLGDIFRAMFPDSNIAQQFNIQSKKMSYVMYHGIGPYFHQELVKQLKRVEKFVLCFDEQTNVQNKKQLDLLVKFWSYDEGLVVTRFYKSIFLGHARANVLRTVIIDSFKTDGVDLRRLLMLGRDNPTVNISLENLIDAELRTMGSNLLLIGSCNLHVVHNGFKSGLSSASWHVENVCTEIYSWFKQSPARKEDLVDTIHDFDDLMEKTLLYFTITRWVLLGKVITRVLTLWEPLCDYFLDFLPTTQKVQIQKNDKYDKIKSNLTSNVIKIRLRFVLFLCENIFDQFLTWFQQEGPLIHLLHHELTRLFSTVLMKFLKSDYVCEKSGSDLLDLDFKLSEKQLTNKQIRIGEKTRTALSGLTQQERETFFNDVRKIYHGIAQYFQSNLPLKNGFLRDVQILHHSLKDVRNADQIIRVARAVPHLLKDSEIDSLRDEWLAYSLEVIDEKWVIDKKEIDSDGNECIIYHRIDFYWNKVLAITTTDGRPKYPALSKLIKNILIISHGNADVERGFSINENIVVQNRSLLSDFSINGLRTAHDAVKSIGRGSVSNVPITKELLKAVKNSHSFYKKELTIASVAAQQSREEEKERDNTNDMYKQMLENEDQLLLKQKDLQREQQELNLLITDGNIRLHSAMKNKDHFDANRAAILIEGVTNRSKLIGDELMKVTEEMMKIQQKRKDAFKKQQRQKKLKI
ncbi:unnamed protein product [Adineta ricciae]|uniref:Uncharacterized protein n=1 Tax=Adineta ricciae TaxID=249248 RepID=A0A814D0M8_ADIRI|nr:unnamed protein product [Adineta ricciae]CAF1306153.1 unnamed protein product [Adineta ricciae]